MKLFIIAAMFIVGLSYCSPKKDSVTVLEKEKTAALLGDKPGLGSPNFFLSDSIFQFSDYLDVEAKIYYQEYKNRYGLEEEMPVEKFFLVKNIDFAVDTSFGADMVVTAMKISQDTADYWHTVYGGSGIYESDAVPKELGGNEESEGFYYIFVCPTEQPWFCVRTLKQNKDKLKEEFKALMEFSALTP